VRERGKYQHSPSGCWFEIGKGKGKSKSTTMEEAGKKGTLERKNDAEFYLFC